MSPPSLRLAPYRALYFFEFIAIGIYAAYFNLYLVQSVGLTKTEVGYLLAIPLVSKCVVPIFWGRLADRFHLRRQLFYLATLSSLSLFLFFPDLQSFPLLAAGMAVYALLGTLIIPFIETFTFRHLGAQWAHYPAIRIMGPVGFLVATLGWGQVIERTSLSSIFFVLCAVYGALFCVSAFWIRDERALSAVEDRDLSVRHLTARSGVVFFFFTVALFRLSHGPYSGYMSIYMREAGYSPGTIGLFFAIPVVTEFLGHRFCFASLLAGRSINRVMAAISAVVALQWGILSFPLSPATIAISLAAHGFSFGLSHVAIISHVNHLFPDPHRTLGQALFSGIYYGLGGGIGVLLTGIALKYSSWSAVFIAAACLALISIFLSLRIKPHAVDLPIEMT